MNLIYQYWLGGLLPGVAASRDDFSAYAERVGSQFMFSLNDPYLSVSGVGAKYFDGLRPVWDEDFDRFENIVVADSDIFPIGIESVFAEPVNGVGMCEESHQPAIRDKASAGICGAKDREWAGIAKKWARVPRDGKGRPRVFNAGLVFWTREGRMKARELFPRPEDYLAEISKRKFHRLYHTDQNYLGAMCFLPGMEFTVLAGKWNAQIHGLSPSGVFDGRGDDTQFVHIQLRGADHWPAEVQRRIATLPQEQWNLPKS